MTPEQWQHIRGVFEAALELETEAQTAYLNEVCKDDMALKREVNALLRSARDPSPFLDTPLELEKILSVHDSELPEKIGSYRLIRRLGQGGMGTVYLVDRQDGAFQKTVAMKLLDRQHLVTRFEQEQDILRHLNHPGIARLIDVGFTPDALSNTGNRPFLVMEYVEGVPIDQYCREENLSVEARLHLFLQVCEAVQYAHENLVLHRDLKPSNILVEQTDKSPCAKLLDFGIAKLLHQESNQTPPLTRTGQYLLTPEYASPEQLRGAPIATTSDVYALGVLLFKVLTDKRPYEVKGKSPREIEEIVCELTPARASEIVETDRLRRHLQGDLDTIVMKALQKEPERRYRTVAEMAEDIQRYLDHLPIKARPDAAWYRFKKFARRHRTATIATLLILMTLLGGIFATGLQSRLVERRSQQIRMLASSLLSDIDLAIRDLPGATKAREQLVTTAVLFLDSLQQEIPDNQTLQLDMANAYDQLARLQGDPHYSNLGSLSEAKLSYQKAYNIRRHFWLKDSTDQDLRHALATSLGHTAVLASWTGDNKLAITQSSEALRLLKLDNPAQLTLDTQYDAARIRSELGWWLIWDGQIEDGLIQLRRAMQMLEQIAPENPDHLDLQLQLWRNYWYQTDGLKFTSQYEVATALLEQKARPHLEALAHRYATNPRVQYGLHALHYFLGEVHLAQERDEAARTAFETSLSNAETMISSDSTNQKAHMAMAFGNRALGLWHFDQGAYEEAIPLLSKASAMWYQLFIRDRENQEAANALSGSHRILCRAFYLNEQLNRAIEACDQAIMYMEPVIDGTPVNGILWGNQGFNYGWLARTYSEKASRESSAEIRTSHLTNALHYYDESLAIMEQLFEHLNENDSAWEFSMDALLRERSEVEASLQ